MKPKEVMGVIGVEGIYAYANVKNFIDEYEEKDCVVAYYAGIFECVYIIRSARKFKAYLTYSKAISRNTREIDLDDAVNAVEMKGENNKIVDKELYKKMKDKLLVEAL